jgi:hypothetical protein
VNDELTASHTLVDLLDRGVYAGVELIAVALAMVASAQGRVGLRLINARSAVVDVAAKFGLAEDEINFDLGPLGRLL